MQNCCSRTKLLLTIRNCSCNVNFRNTTRTINNDIIFFLARNRAEFSGKCCNLIGSKSGRFLTILSASLGGIVGSVFHKFFFFCEWAKTVIVISIFLLKLAVLLALAREKWILLFRQKNWRENQAIKPGKPPKYEIKTGGSWCRFTSFITYAVSTAILILCTVYSIFLLCL